MGSWVWKADCSPEEALSNYEQILFQNLSSFLLKQSLYEVPRIVKFTESESTLEDARTKGGGENGELVFKGVRVSV